MSPNLLHALMSTDVKDHFARCAAARYGGTWRRAKR